jgi:hypothetical protein
MFTKDSPQVKKISWGSLVTEDGTRFKDAKLFPGGAREWDWAETGTSHSPGIQFEDIRELIDHGATVIVLSQGMNGRLQVAPGTLDRLKQLGIGVHVLPSKEAVELYNRLRKSEAVAALVHSTC